MATTTMQPVSVTPIAQVFDATRERAGQEYQAGRMACLTGHPRTDCSTESMFAGWDDAHAENYGVIVDPLGKGKPLVVEPEDWPTGDEIAAILHPLNPRTHWYDEPMTIADAPGHAECREWAL